MLVVAIGNEEGLFDPAVRIFFSDDDIPPAVVSGLTTEPAGPYLAEAGINAVEVEVLLNGEKGLAAVRPLNLPAMRLHEPIPTVSGPLVEKFEMAAGRASGTVAVDGPSIAFTGAFDAPVRPNPVTDDVRGPEAIDSAQAQTLLACMAALRKADTAAMTKLFTASRAQWYADARAAIGDVEFKRQVYSYSDPAALRARIERVVSRGPNASVLGSDRHFYELVRDGDAWKCAD